MKDIITPISCIHIIGIVCTKCVKESGSSLMLTAGTPTDDWLTGYYKQFGKRVFCGLTLTHITHILSMYWIDYIIRTHITLIWIESTLKYSMGRPIMAVF